MGEHLPAGAARPGADLYVVLGISSTLALGGSGVKPTRAKKVVACRVDDVLRAVGLPLPPWQRLKVWIQERPGMVDVGVVHVANIRRALAFEECDCRA